MYHRTLVYKVLLYQPAHLICLLDFLYFKDTTMLLVSGRVLRCDSGRLGRRQTLTMQSFLYSDSLVFEWERVSMFTMEINDEPFFP